MSIYAVIILFSFFTFLSSFPSIKSNVRLSQEAPAPEASLLWAAPLEIMKMSMNRPNRYGSSGMCCPDAWKQEWAR